MRRLIFVIALSLLAGVWAHAQVKLSETVQVAAFRLQGNESTALVMLQIDSMSAEEWKRETKDTNLIRLSTPIYKNLVVYPEAWAKHHKSPEFCLEDAQGARECWPFAEAMRRIRSEAKTP
jgi:DTW domain-containing protein YfiP